MIRILDPPGSSPDLPPALKRVFQRLLQPPPEIIPLYMDYALDAECGSPPAWVAEIEAYDPGCDGTLDCPCLRADP